MKQAFLFMESANLENKTILVVEDEERNWFLLRDIIQLCKGKPVWAESAMDGIEEVKKNKDIALVLMDIRLPFMGGVEATKRIKSIRADLPVIVQTAFAEQKDVLEYTRAGCNDYLFKPLEFNKVIAVLKKYLTN